MRRIYVLVALLFMCASCSEGAGKIDVDFSKFSSVMAYSGIYDMMINPDSYLGKTVRVKGKFDTIHDDETGEDYFAVVVMDASMCCAAGLDFTLKGKRKYPDDYPEIGTEITVTGKFERYTEGEDVYYRLGGSDMLLQ